MDRIQIQASKLWETLFSDETAQTYQAALNLTGNILKESAQLIWLVLCSFFVFGAWFGDASVKTGKGVRDWVDNTDKAIAPSLDASNLSTATVAKKGKSLLETSRESAANLLAKAREELGLDPNAPLAQPREDSPVAKLVTPSETSSTPDNMALAPNPESSITTTESAPSTPSPTAPSDTASLGTAPSNTEPASTTDSATAATAQPSDDSPAAGVATARPATSEGQEIGTNAASSRGSGSAARGFGNSFADRTPGSQSGGPQSSKYAGSQDFDDDTGEDDSADDSSWPPQSDD